jgi:hypothetical protein
MKRNLRLMSWVFGLLVVVVVLAEFGLRAFGLNDFPLYLGDSHIGYIPAANQHGSFMNKNDWTFNSIHMGAPEFAPGPQRDVLIIGDSVVYGGNPFKQEERLGPQLAHQLKDAKVWPISAGSWSIRNELIWLSDHPEVVSKVEDIVFVLNNGDPINEASSWKCEITHPRHYPVSVLLYEIRKELKLDNCTDIPEGLKVPDVVWQEQLQAWLASDAVKGKRIHFVLYPSKDEFAFNPSIATASTRHALEAVGNFRIMEVARQDAWKASYFRDSIHPTAEGNVVLAQLIAQFIQ